MFSNPVMWLALTAVLALQVGVTHLAIVQNLFGTTSISGAQWIVCVAVAISVEEIRKLFVRPSMAAEKGVPR